MRAGKSVFVGKMIDLKKTLWSDIFVFPVNVKRKVLKAFPDFLALEKRKWKDIGRDLRGLDSSNFLWLQ